MLNHLDCAAANYSNFLLLPRELRDLIYDTLINSPQTRIPPADPERAGDRIFQGKIYFEAHSPRPALLQLKLCNRQLYSEVTEALRRNGDRIECKDGSHHDDPPYISTGLYGRCNTPGPPARLDIMIKGSSIWPTWTSLPPTRLLNQTIAITLRLFESATHPGSEFSTGAYRGLWSFFNLLVSHGPCLIHNRQLGGLAKPLRIGRLRFDIRLCFPPAGVDDLFGTYRDVFGRLEKLAFDNVGLGGVEVIEAELGMDRRVWRLRQLSTGLTLPSRIE